MQISSKCTDVSIFVYSTAAGQPMPFNTVVAIGILFLCAGEARQAEKPHIFGLGFIYQIPIYEIR